ncbi:hypothetical protein H4684_003461 [Desulfomicrobium macestii]|uniref:Uncharacterized protein n=1 Tax=Desulfomicrobium macestii TaxID=90731 RepID=A0ABR9H7U1_9BACT|nr:hypothetical protein [Desulfomicrobium macestii]MBE1426786.1 hypothetical protein [Desulfomicrobium macestii]
MPVQKNTASIKWVNGYTYWKGQYTVRNINYKQMANEKNATYDYIYSLCGENIELKKILYKSCLRGINYFENTDLDFYNDNYNDISRLLELSKYINNNFSYACWKQNPLDIVNDICIGKSLNPVERDSSIISYNINERNILHVSVDINNNTNYIITDIRDLLKYIKHEYLKNDFNALDFGILVDYDIKRIQEELCAKGVVYRTVSDESRAIGLLLFDYIEENEVSDAEGIRRVRKKLKEHGPKNFGKANSSERQFQRWLANTRKCIDAVEVLEI